MHFSAPSSRYLVRHKGRGEDGNGGANALVCAKSRRAYWGGNGFEVDAIDFHARSAQEGDAKSAVEKWKRLCSSGDM